jgi:hypothetical protein
MEDTEVQNLTSRAECAEAVEKLIESANSQIAIFSQQLEPLLYNHARICHKISAISRSHRHSDIRIIALSTRAVAANGHCLIELAQRLPSSIQIRTPKTEELQHFRESWLITDDHSIMQINDPDRYQGSLIQHNRLHVKTQLDYFNYAWENSEQDQNTRRLSL